MPLPKIFDKHVRGWDISVNPLDIRTTGSTNLDVESSDTELLAAGSDVLSSQHGCVRARLVPVRLDFHSTSYAAYGFAACQIGNVDEGIVE